LGDTGGCGGVPTAGRPTTTAASTPTTAHTSRTHRSICFSTPTASTSFFTADGSADSSPSASARHDSDRMAARRASSHDSALAAAAALLWAAAAQRSDSWSRAVVRWRAAPVPAASSRRRLICKREDREVGDGGSGTYMYMYMYINVGGRRAAFAFVETRGCAVERCSRSRRLLP